MKDGHMSSYERVSLALAHKETDRVPIAMVCSGINDPAGSEFDALIRSKGYDGTYNYLDPILDITGVGPGYHGPSYESGYDMWGVRRKSMKCGLATYYEIDHHPLANAESMDEITQFPWPNPDWFDYTVLPNAIAAERSGRQRYIMAGTAPLYETSWYLRGFEQMFMDLAVNPEIAHEIMNRVTDFYCEYIQRVLTAANDEVDLVFTADDVGGQNGLLMSIKMWEEFIKTYHVRLNKIIHEHGAKIIYHSDGAVMDVVDGLIYMGVDVLQPLQFDAAKMDAVEIKATHGERLCFQGGVSVQSTLPFGTPELVQEEVKHLITTLGKDGGYILGPSHAIQAGTPPENIFAMFETAQNFYPYK
jgi:uroporphyrinogen decarboxylase